MGMLGNRCDGDAWQQVRWGCLATGAMGMLARGTAREFALHGKFAAPLLICPPWQIRCSSAFLRKRSFEATIRVGAKKSEVPRASIPTAPTGTHPIASLSRITR